MTYLIKAELPNMEDFKIADCNDADEALKCGHDMAINLVDTDLELTKEILREARQALEYEGNVSDKDAPEWLDKVYCDIIKERSSVSLWPLKKGINYEEVLKETNNNWEEIINKYIIKD